MSVTNQLHYEDTEAFTKENGFNIAVGFTAYDSSTEWILDRTYGRLVFTSHTWGHLENGDPF